MWVSILADIDFNWRQEKVDEVISLWEQGECFNEIVDICDGRDGDEVFLLLMHLSRRKKIKKRKGFIWGRGKKE